MADYYYAHGCNVTRTARHFDISRKTLYVWLRRYRPHDLSSLESRSRRPHRVRQRRWDVAVVTAVQQPREQYRCWGKDTLVVPLRRAGTTVSTSMVGRILADLRRRGVLPHDALHQRGRPRGGRL